MCGGDGTSCIGCDGVRFSTCEYDACDVCCGDNTSCLSVPPERDPCLPRFQSNSVCQFFVGDVFVMRLGDDTDGGRNAGRLATATIAERGVVIVESKLGQTYQRWLLDDPSEGALQISDLGSFPEDLGCVKTQTGSYSYTWDRSCNLVNIRSTREDPCGRRRNLLAGSVQLRRQRCPKFYKKQHDSSIFSIDTFVQYCVLARGLRTLCVWL